MEALMFLELRQDKAVCNGFFLSGLNGLFGLNGVGAGLFFPKKLVRTGFLSRIGAEPSLRAAVKRSSFLESMSRAEAFIWG